MQDLSSTEVVRKSIPLKLKKPKLKLKGSKSSKSKKDKKSSSSSDHKETSSGKFCSLYSDLYCFRHSFCGKHSFTTGTFTLKSILLL